MRIPIGLIKGTGAGRYNFVIGGTVVIFGLVVLLFEQYDDNLPDDFVVQVLLVLFFLVPVLLYDFHDRTEGLKKLPNTFRIPVWQIVSQQIPILSLCVAGAFVWGWFFPNHFRTGDATFLILLGVGIELALRAIRRLS